jgi:hypothetical protein
MGRGPGLDGGVGQHAGHPVHVLGSRVAPADTRRKGDVLGPKKQGNFVVAGPPGQFRVGQDHEFADQKLRLGGRLLFLPHDPDVRSLADQFQMRILLIEDHCVGGDAMVAKHFRQKMGRGEGFDPGKDVCFHLFVVRIGMHPDPAQARFDGPDPGLGVQNHFQ